MTESVTDLITQRKREAKEARVDENARIVARAGKDEDGGGYNYEASKQTPRGTMNVRATFGAGTRTATIRLDGVLVYECGDTGRNLTLYRPGEWVNDLRAWADEVARSTTADKEIRMSSDEARIRDNFAPFDRPPST